WRPGLELIRRFRHLEPLTPSANGAAVFASNLLDARGRLARLRDARSDVGRELLGELSMLRSLGEIDELDRVRLVIVELAAPSSVGAPFRVSIAIGAEAVAVVALRERRLPHACRRIAQERHKALSRAVGRTRRAAELGDRRVEIHQL